jgi:RNA polymerase sigma-70 factor (ECF subfamily)
MQKISDNDLVKLFQNENNAALEELIKRHKKSIFTAIYLLVKNRSLAEDIFQETFIKIIQTLRNGNYNEEGKFVGWAVRVARNLTIDYLRKINKDLTITDSQGNDIFSYLVIADTQNKEEQLIQYQTEQQIKRLVLNLPEEQKQVVVLRHWANLSFKEIAEQTGVSVNTALGRMRYALANIRKQLEENKVILH